MATSPSRCTNKSILLVQVCVDPDQLLISSLPQQRNPVQDSDPVYHYTENDIQLCYVSTIIGTNASRGIYASPPGATFQ